MKFFCPPSSALRPQIIAHRGASGYAPENTMAAFRRALELGADAIELDVVQSRDGELMVIHDETPRRTTRTRGRVDDFTADNLKQLDAGSWFAPEFRGERIPTLREVLAWVRGKTQVWIEIKSANPNLVLKTIREEKMLDHVVVFSLKLDVMESLINAPVDRSLVFPRYTRRIPTIRQLCDLADALNLTSVAPHYSLVTKRFVEQLHKENLGVAVWTANRKLTIRRLIRADADAIITNYPDRVRKI